LTNPLTSIHALAPLRLSFAGGGTDFPHYFEEHGGAVLSATMDWYARVTVQPRDDRQVRLRSLDLGHLVEYHVDEDPVYDGILDLAKAAVRRMGVSGGIEMDIRSDAPAGSGLGGSSALVTAIVAALSAAAGREPSPEELAQLSYTIEREDAGIPGGMQDQYAAAYGGFNVVEFSSDGVWVVPIRIDAPVLEELERRLLLCYTGHIRTDLGLIDEQIRMYREGREETLLGMKGLHEMVYAMREVLESGDIGRFGEMLHEAYESKKLMNPHVVRGTPTDVLYERARELGATGGKLCGAGGGGYLLLYCEPQYQMAVKRELSTLGGQFASFGFNPSGVSVRKE
jgi:D-glycero-alpha-D-manno-heptose-7-phosphate kinase